MIGAPNTRDQKYWVGIAQWAPESSVLEEIADIFRNYNIDSKMKGMKFPVEFCKWISNSTLHWACGYLYMLWSELIYVSKSGPGSNNYTQLIHFWNENTCVAR